jgi:GTPase SAR1 family protein
MGACSSKTPEEREAANKSAALDREMKSARKEDASKLKLLLLGTGESGKSTMLKQMQLLYGKGYSEDECASYRPIIWSNLVASITTMLTETLKRNEDAKAELDACCGGQAVTEWLASLPSFENDLTAILTPKMGGEMKALWLHQAVQATYDVRAEYQLTDSAKYFFDLIDEVMQPEYRPSVDHVLRSRVRTTGIIENNFSIEGHEFEIYDVGGQRSERKKWISCFSGVNAVLFVGVLSEYDLVLFEDASTNRMAESVNLWAELTAVRYFAESSMILFLNKADLFQEKIKNVPLSACPLFSDISGLVSYEEGCAAIQEAYENAKQGPFEDKKIYCHFTCATDKEGMKTVLNAVKDSVIEKALNEAGLA